MKKSTIWILAAIMAFAFFGLLYLQIEYLRESIGWREDQFDETINRSLDKVSSDLQKEQTKKYLNEGFTEYQKKQTAANNRALALRNQQLQEETVTHRQRIKMVAPEGSEVMSLEYSASTTVQTKPKNQVFSPPTKDGTNAISKTLWDMQDEQKQRLIFEGDLLNDVLNQIVNTASSVPIEERVNLKELGTNIKNEIKVNGIELPFQYEVVDKNNKPIYQQPLFSPQNTKPYTKVLFANDPQDKLAYLKVYFPDKSKYIFREISFLYPAIGFSLILLVTFIITIYITFRQKRLSEMKSDFMNNMTHELKTPVSTISLAAQMLKDGSITKSPEVFKHISGVINDETERLSFQVEKVLQMSLFEKQKATLKMKELDANDIVVNVANTFQLKVEKFGGNLDIDLEATESTIDADKMHFTNVLFNLLDNAVKYRREDVPLELMIRTWNNNNKLYISVEDNGIGIKKEFVKKIFERFYRVSTGNRHDVKGFGLGLAYVRKIVEDHKGTIKAESDLGKGTKFIICLPLMKNNDK
jgi:signal transduction histidine kinase